MVKTTGRDIALLRHAETTTLLTELKGIATTIFIANSSPVINASMAATARTTAAGSQPTNKLRRQSGERANPIKVMKYVAFHRPQRTQHRLPPSTVKQRMNRSIRRKRPIGSSNNSKPIASDSCSRCLYNAPSTICSGNTYHMPIQSGTEASAHLSTNPHVTFSGGRMIPMSSNHFGEEATRRHPSLNYIERQRPMHYHIRGYLRM